MTEQASPTTLYPPPAKELDIVVDGETRTLKMSYGLQDKLLRLVKDTNEVGNIFTDPEIRNPIISELLAERSNTGRVIGQLRQPDEYEIDLEEVDKLLAWAVDTVTSFFIRSLESLNRKLVPIPQQVPETTETASTPS